MRAGRHAPAKRLLRPRARLTPRSIRVPSLWLLLLLIRLRRGGTSAPHLVVGISRMRTGTGTASAIHGLFVPNGVVRRRRAPGVHLGHGDGLAVPISGAVLHGCGDWTPVGVVSPRGLVSIRLIGVEMGEGRHGVGIVVRAGRGEVGGGVVGFVHEGAVDV